MEYEKKILNPFDFRDLKKREEHCYARDYFTCKYFNEISTTYMYTYTSNLYDYSFSKKIEYSNYRSSNTRIVILFRKKSMFARVWSRQKRRLIA